MFRPPSEANSLILRVADGCPWNSCLFCGMYKGVPYRVLQREEMACAVTRAAREFPASSRIFLADGDVMAMPYADLHALLDIVAGLALRHTIFRANHTSNVVPIGGRFPRDKPRLLGEMDDLLASGLLDTESPGSTPLAL